MSMAPVYVNGETLAIDGPLPLTDLLRRQGIDAAQASGVAVALNERVVRRVAWEETEVSPGDHVEIVTAKQGG